MHHTPNVTDIVSELTDMPVIFGAVSDLNFRMLMKILKDIQHGVCYNTIQ